jgi:Ca2+-binding EF-hand superfamily protein
MKSDSKMQNRRQAMRSITFIIAFTWGVLGGSGAQAADRTWGDGTLPDYLAVFDVNGNGVLSAEEIQAMKAARANRHNEWLSQWDADGDGVINGTERTKAQEALRQRIEDCRIGRFEEADTDGDGCLTFAEFSAIPAVMELAKRDPNAPARIYARLDADDSDCITVEEFTSHLQKRPKDWRTGAAYATADTNADGCLTLAEFSAIPAVVRLAEEHPEAPAMMYNQLDANNDNCLSLEEFTAVIQPHEQGDWRTAATYAAADIDADGCLTLAEFSAIPEVARLAQEHPEVPAMMYGQLDANDDNCLSLEEFTADPSEDDHHGEPGDWRIEATYLTADGDVDGCLTLAEFSTIPEVVQLAQEHPEAPAKIYGDLDTDDDDCLSLAEFTAPRSAEPPPPRPHRN